MSKNTYSASIASIVQEGLFTKSSAGIINSSFYLFYGTTQFVGGYLADRFSPFKITLIGLVGAMLSNLVMASTDLFPVMLIAWSVNGIVQFGIWPAILKIVSTMLAKEHRYKSMLYISFGYCAGMMCSYISAMVLGSMFRWNSLFYFSAVALGVSALVFYASGKVVQRKLVYEAENEKGITSERNATEGSTSEGNISEVSASEGNISEVSALEGNTSKVSDSEGNISEGSTLEGKGSKKNPTEEKTEQTQGDISLWKLCLQSGLLLLLLPALIRCMLDLGMKSWVPTMIMENYGTSPGFSNLLTGFLLLVNLTGVYIVAALYPKRFQNAVTVIAILFVASLPMLGAMYFIGKIPLALVLILLAIITTLMNAGNQLFNVVLPNAYAPYGKLGTVAGILNAFACFGSVLANFLYGWVAEHFGWSATIAVWIILAVVALIVSVITVPMWRKFRKIL